MLYYSNTSQKNEMLGTLRLTFIRGPFRRACEVEFCSGDGRKAGTGYFEKETAAVFIAAGEMTGSDHIEANRAPANRACFTMKATHIDFSEPIEPEKAPENKIAIFDGEVA